MAGAGDDAGSIGSLDLRPGGSCSEITREIGLRVVKRCIYYNSDWVG